MRVYLPPDANCLLSVADHCLRSRDYVNVDRRRQAAGAGLPDDGRGDRALHARPRHLATGRATRATASPDVVLACAGDVPTLETLAAAAILRERLPDLKVRVVNVVDLMRLQPETEHPHGLADARVRRAVHRRPAGDLRLPRLSVADPPAHLPAHQPPQPPRARLQGGGHDDDAVRHGHAQRPGPLPPRHGRDRPRARARHARRRPAPGDGGRAARAHRAYTREHGEDAPDGPRLGLAGGADAGRARPRRQRRVEQPEAVGCSTPPTALLGRRDLPWPRGEPTSPPARSDATAGTSTRSAHRDRARRRALHRAACGSTTTSRAALRDADRPRAAAPAARRSPRSTRSAAVLPGRAGGRVLRHRVPRRRCPPAAATYALPRRGASLALRRFGFHGLSHA